ncbi:MAG: YitT family protein [Candidatus Cloacimonetes bacterium]|nr:YitT family protein [Candidatus Cloacimonadota bacterium]
MNQKVKDYLLVVSGGVIYALALKYFVFPSRVVLTGTEGIATALSYYFSNFWLFIGLYSVFQSILLTFAFFHVSRRFAIRSLVTVCTVVILLILLPEFRFAHPDFQDERIILVLFGGILAGVGKAMAFKAQGSTADEDILAAYFAMKYLKPVGAIAVIAAVASTAFGLFMNYLKDSNPGAVINTLMYTCIYIFASTETLNNLYKKFQITMFTVITKNPGKISKAITDTFDHRTFTVQSAVEGHTTEEEVCNTKNFSMLRTIITKEELPKLIQEVEKQDSDCFFYYHDVEGVSKSYYITPIG